MALSFRAEIKVEINELLHVAARARNIRPALEGPVQGILTNYARLRFESEGAFGGNKWKGLFPSTLRSRARAGHGRGGIGVDTGRMWASLVKTPSPEGISVVGNNTLFRTTRVPYAVFFNRVRPLFPDRTPPVILDHIEKAVAHYIETGLVTS